MTTLVVGYDGSLVSRAAVDYAARRVGPGGRLSIVHAGPDDDGRALLDELGLEAPPAVLDTDYELELLRGDPADQITRRARQLGADEIVLGSRGAGHVDIVLGSVSRGVIQRADRPVVVVPSHAVMAVPRARH